MSFPIDRSPLRTQIRKEGKMGEEEEDNKDRGVEKDREEEMETRN
jgi:hypothetical protein